MVVNFFRQVETNIKITGMMICLVSGCMFLVNMPEPTNNLQIFMTSEVMQTSPQQFTHQQMYAQDSNTYIPPNYGGPDSQYGSGTR